MEHAGIDLGKRESQIAIITEAGELVEKRLRTERERLRRFFVDRPKSRILMEASTISEWVARVLEELGHEVVVADPNYAPMYAQRSRRVKTDRRDARALAEMLQSGWYTEVFVKSEESHRMKALLSARDQLVRNKRTFFGQIRGMLRPFGIRLPARQGTRKFDEAARAACRHDDLLYACVNALLEALGAIEAQIAALDKRVRAMVQTSKACWYLTSVPCVGPITALAFAAAIEDPGRFRRSRDVGAYLGLTPRRWQSGEKDIVGVISKQGDAMARHCLYEAANCLLTTWGGRSALKSWGLRLVKRVGAKKARVAVARKLACLLLGLWKAESHYDEDQVRTA